MEEENKYHSGYNGQVLFEETGGNPWEIEHLCCVIAACHDDHVLLTPEPCVMRAVSVATLQYIGEAILFVWRNSVYV